MTTAYAPHGMAMNRVAYASPSDNGYRVNNRPRSRADVAAACGVEPWLYDIHESIGMAKIAAKMATLGYEEFQERVLTMLLRCDHEWVNRGPGRPPHNLIEYLQWHRDRRAAKTEAEKKREDSARARMLTRLALASERDAVRNKRREEAAARKEAERLARIAAKPPVVLKDDPEAVANREAKREQRRRAREAERDAANAKRHATAMSKVRAGDLLNEVCYFLGVDAERVVGTGKTDMLLHARRLFVCMARDTSYCGVQPSFPAIGSVIGHTHSSAFMLNVRGMETPSVIDHVRIMCQKLGIAAPAYAVAAKEGSAA